MAVEHHGDATHEVPARGSDLDLLVAEPHHAQGLELAQLLEFGGEVFLELEQVRYFDGIEIDATLCLVMIQLQAQ